MYNEHIISLKVDIEIFLDSPTVVLGMTMPLQLLQQIHHHFNGIHFFGLTTPGQTERTEGCLGICSSRLSWHGIEYKFIIFCITSLKKL